MQQKQRVCEFRAPAKLILCGEHAVVYGQDAVAMSIGLHCKAVISKRKVKSDCSTIAFELEIEQQAIQIDSELVNEFHKLQQEFGGNFTYQLFLQKISFNHLDKSKSFKSLHYKLGLFLINKRINWKIWNKESKIDWFIRVSSRIPLGKGLGSSAAFNTVLSFALHFIFAEICQNQISDLNFELKQQINELAYLFQCVQHGNPSGIDNFVSVHGGLIVFNRSKQPKFRMLKGAAQKLRSKVDLAIADSKVEKNTKIAVQRVRQHYKSHESYVEMIKQIGKISSRLIEILSSSGQFEQKQLGNLIEKNHKLLTQFGLSNPQIQKLIQLGKASGWCGKITGSGMGGCILLVAPCGQGIMKQQFILTPFDEKGLAITFCQSKS